MRTVVLVFVLILQGTLGDLVVQLPNGKVQGTTVDTPSGKIFYAWRGIPYAKPPIKELRYLPPVKAEPWDDVLDASEDSPPCIMFIKKSGGSTSVKDSSEDCLYINVYSPDRVDLDLRVNANLSVMVWIYGGAFIAGDSGFNRYDPTAFLEENVIVVSFNYRLGPLGFLSTEDDVILGNAALKDQNLALQWVQENIAFFGGNPNDVTIFGESAGAMSVGYHIVSPMSRNLFKRAILESGCAITNMFQKGARNNSVTLASQIDSSITNASTSDEIKQVLQAAPIDLILELAANRILGPVIEVETNQSFLTNPLYEAIESGDIAQVPVIIGYNSEESISFTSGFEEQAAEIDSNPTRLLPNMILKENVNATSVGQEIHQHYVGKDGLFVENIATFLEWFSDNLFVRSSTKHAILQSKYSPVYMYQFSFYGSASKNNPVVPGAGRVSHGQELPYLFNVSTQPLETEADFLTRRRFVKLWTNFAKTSNPTPDDDSAELLQNVKWVPINADNITLLDIDDNLQIKSDRKDNETIFWDYLWSTYAVRPYNTY